MIELGLMGVLALVWAGFFAGFVASSAFRMSRDDAREWDEICRELDMREETVRREDKGGA